MYQRSSYKVVCLYIRLHGEIHKTGTTETTPYVEELLPSYYAGKTADVGEKEFERLLGRKLPEAGYRFYKKNRMVIDENCTVADLRYSKRWVGRLFSGAIRFAHAFLWKTGNRSAANTNYDGRISSARARACKVRRNVAAADGRHAGNVQRTSV